MDWREEPVGRRHNRKGFDCGEPALNEYLARYARQNHESGGAKTFVAVKTAEPERILGYYSISPSAVAFERAPAKMTKKLGRYDIPVYQLGRLAVDLTVQKQGLGSGLLLAAARRALTAAEQVGGIALAIDAKDERAARWYEQFGALRLLDDPLGLMLSLNFVDHAFKTEGTKR